MTKKKHSPKKKSQSCGAKKVAVVMKEFYDGKLHRKGGKKVKDPNVAKAIAYSEARKKCGGQFGK